MFWSNVRIYYALLGIEFSFNSDDILDSMVAR
jgi:hypothetical protein